MATSKIDTGRWIHPIKTAQNIKFAINSAFEFYFAFFFGTTASKIEARLKIPFLAFNFLENDQKSNLYAIFLVHGILAQESPKRDTQLQAVF